jgi:hypothetical protein
MVIDPLAVVPMPMASPPIDITVGVTPPRSIRIRAISMENGMVREATRAPRRSHMKHSINATISAAPMSIDAWT